MVKPSWTLLFIIVVVIGACITSNTNGQLLSTEYLDSIRSESTYGLYFGGNKAAPAAVGDFDCDGVDDFALHYKDEYNINYLLVVYGHDVHKDPTSDYTTRFTSMINQLNVDGTVSPMTFSSNDKRLGFFVRLNSTMSSGPSPLVVKFSPKQTASKCQDLYIGVCFMIISH